ncbi:MAG: restriction endonuclease subunit S [Hafnia alvei]
MAKYKAYPKYKDSGVEWLGEIPSHWNVAKTMRYFKIAMGQTILKEQLEDDGEWPVYSATEGDSYFGYVSSPQVRLGVGDLVIPARGNSIGSVKLVLGKSTTTQTTIYCKHLTQAIYPAFAYYFMLGNRKNLFWFTQTAIPQITVEEVGCNPILLPTYEEQGVVASFLDHETAKIDNLIEKQQQLIELLKEKRQAVISHAVTKGLNPDVPMKDSGVEWLGEVPKHWSVIPLKYICTLIKDGTHLPPSRVNKGVPLLSVRNIINGTFQFRDDDSQISHKDYQSLCSSFIPKKDDVLLAIVGATLGKVALVPEMDLFHIQRSLGVFRTNKLINPKHLHYIFESKDFQSLLWENAGFSAQPGIYLGTLSNFYVPVPSTSEQVKIIEFITATVDKLDLLISQASQLITLIQERRTALISAAVTGKIDVRDWGAPDTQGVEEPQEATA